MAEINPLESHSGVWRRLQSFPHVERSADNVDPKAASDVPDVERDLTGPSKNQQSMHCTASVQAATNGSGKGHRLVWNQTYSHLSQKMTGMQKPLLTFQYSSKHDVAAIQV